MQNALLLLPPVVNVIVTAFFAAMILRQYLDRHRSYQLYWSIALVMAFLATLAYIGILLAQPTNSSGILFFRLYYILGGAIMPAWLGLGSIALVCDERVTRIYLGIVSVLSLLAALFVFTARINLDKLSQIAGTPGTGILEPGAWLALTITLNTAGVIAVAGVALYSGWKIRRRQPGTAGLPTRSLLYANILILVGDLLNAIAGSLARFLGIQSTFWLIMAVGWLVFFYGVVLASRRPKVASIGESSVAQSAHAGNPASS
jgi:hypothetical protein